MAVQQKFFDELSVVLEHVAAYQDAVYIVGDMNIRLDRPTDIHADQLRSLVECYGLVLHATGPTHQLGGILDVVITHDVTGCPDCITVEDVGLSDHFSAIRDPPPSVTLRSRPWRSLDMEEFISALATSRLCQPDDWPADVDEMAAMYDSELNAVLDGLLPVRQYVRRQRPSDPCFDKDCRAAKRLTRRLERAYSVVSRRATSASTVNSDNAALAAKAAAAKNAWYDQRRTYRQLRHRNCAEFWHNKLEANQSDPQKL